jgi:siroheme synthase
MKNNIFFNLLSGDPKIIHRNIKTANILVDYNYEAKVINEVVSVLGAFSDGGVKNNTK